MLQKCATWQWNFDIAGTWSHQHTKLQPPTSNDSQTVLKSAKWQWNFELWHLRPWKVGQIKNHYNMCSHFRCAYSKNLVILLAITVSLGMTIMRFSITPPGGHIQNLIMRKFGTDIAETLSHHHTKLQSINQSNLASWSWWIFAITAPYVTAPYVK